MSYVRYDSNPTDEVIATITRRNLELLLHSGCVRIGSTFLDNLDVKTLTLVTEDAARDLVLQLESYILAEKVGPTQFQVFAKDGKYKTWWEAVKDRWYPKWAKNRWPVRYETVMFSLDVNRYNMYPGSNEPIPKLGTAYPIMIVEESK